MVSRGHGVMALGGGGGVAGSAPVALVIGVGVGIAIAGFALVRGWERARLEAEFEWRGRGVAAAVEKRTASDLEVLYAIRALVEVSPEVDARAFRSFVQGSLRRNSNVQALSWNPRVGAGERAAYEAAGRRDAGAGFAVTELGPDRRLLTARPPAQSLPSPFIQPPPGNDPALAFHTLSA